MSTCTCDREPPYCPECKSKGDWKTRAQELEAECNKLTHIAERHRQNASERLSKLFESEARELKLRESFSHCLNWFKQLGLDKSADADIRMSFHSYECELVELPAPPILEVLREVEGTLERLHSPRITTENNFHDKEIDLVRAKLRALLGTE